MKAEMRAHFVKLYRETPVSLIKNVTTGSAKSTRVAFRRAQAKGEVWAKNLMVCYDCRWLGQRSRLMIGKFVVPAFFGVLSGAVTVLEKVMKILKVVLEAIYHGTTRVLWGKNWQERQAG